MSEHSSTEAEVGAERIVRNDDKGRYEVWLGDALAGIAAFEPGDDGIVVFPHTVVGEEFEGRGIASRLVGFAMADAAERGDTVVPVCSYVRAWLGKHDVAGLSVRLPGDDVPADTV